MQVMAGPQRWWTVFSKPVRGDVDVTLRPIQAQVKLPAGREGDEVHSPRHCVDVGNLLRNCLERRKRSAELLACADVRCREVQGAREHAVGDRKSTRLNSSHVEISYAVFCLKKKKK